MTRTATHMVGARQLALVYAATFIGGYLFFITMTFVLLHMFAFRFPGILTAILVVFFAGYYVGQFWCSKELTQPTSRRVWKMAAVCAIVPVALTAAVMCGILNLFSETDEVDLTPTSGSTALMLVLLAVVYSLLNLVVIRLGLVLGIKLAARSNSNYIDNQA